MELINKIYDLNTEFLNEIREKVRSNGGIIKLPYYYDEYNYADVDIDKLIADGYDIKEGRSDDNPLITLDGDVEPIAVTLGDIGDSDAIIIIGSDQYRNRMNQWDNPFCIATILREINKVLNK